MPYMLLLVLQGRPKTDCTVIVVIFTGALVVELSIRDPIQLQMSMHLLTETLLFGKSTAYAPVQTVIPGRGMHGDSVLATLMLSLGRAVASCSIFVFF